MPIGPGKYDDLCTLVRKKAKAQAAIVIIVGGEKGEGFSCQTVLPAFDIAEALENVAKQMRQSMATTKLKAPRWTVFKRGHWRLYAGDSGVELGSVQQFQDDGPYYATWEAVSGEYAGGRSGAMSTLEDAKGAVEEKVQPR